MRGESEKPRNLYRPKELSWLAFNERVLQEAMNPEVPLIERFKFLGIYSNNLDEFFRVRVATVKRFAEIDHTKALAILGEDPQTLMHQVNEVVLAQRIQYEKAYNLLLKELEKYNILFVNETELNARQKDFALKFFNQKVRPRLMPLMVDQATTFPDLEDDTIYLAVILMRKGQTRKRYAIIKIPTESLPRYLVLPRRLTKKYVIFLDDVIRLGLLDLFQVFDFHAIEAYTIKLTKDAELDISDDLGASYLQKVSEGLKRRDEGDPVRLVYDASMPRYLLQFLKKNIGITENDSIIPGGKYHNLKDFMNFPNLGTSRLTYDPMPPVSHPGLSRARSMFSSIRERDMLLHFPYHSFYYFIDLLREASIDPKVRSIMITLYRLADNSNVINALLNAVRNGKEVTAVVELQARFSERSNIQYSNMLREEGVRVIYGIQGLKVHSKLCLIKREEKGTLTSYACIGTGNFNEESAKVFSDVLLLTSHPVLGEEVGQVFNFFFRNFEIGRYQYLLPSPFLMRDTFVQLIRKEVNAARAGLPGIHSP
jgi:polyphosphate kinase